MPELSWPVAVNGWATLIYAAAERHGVAPHQIAAIMAIESGGKPGACLRTKSGACHLGEGIGLMAVLVSTAGHFLGRPVTVEELLNDHALNIDVGARVLRRGLDQYDNEFVHAAVAYNAGSVRCGHSSVFGKEKKEQCPSDDWGVVQGCVRRQSPVPGGTCAASVLVPGMFNCLVGYPQKAVAAYNAALTHFPKATTLPLPRPEPPRPGRPAATSWPIAVASAGIVVGLLAAVAAVPRLSRAR
jgi:hypothetical protein